MRCLLMIAAVLLHPALIPPASADDKADRERKVKVALALSAKPPDVCGKCREDVPEARADAIRERKPLVLFVGGPCDGLGCAAEKAGAIPAKAPQYTADGLPAASKRIVVLEPKADGSGMMIATTLPAAARPDELTAAIKAATPKPKAAPAVVLPKPLNWDL